MQGPGAQPPASQGPGVAAVSLGGRSLSNEDVEALGGILERDAMLRLNIEALCCEAFNN